MHGLEPSLQLHSLGQLKTLSQFETLVYPNEFVPAVEAFAYNIGCYPEDKKKKLIGIITDCFEKHVSNATPKLEEWVALDKAFSLIATNISDKRSKDRQFEQAAKYVWYIQKIANRTLSHIPEEIKPKIVITFDSSRYVVPSANFNNLHLETFRHPGMVEGIEDVLKLPKFEDPRSLQAVLDYLEGDKEYVSKYVDMDNIEEIMAFGFVHKMDKMLTDCSKYAAVLMKEGLDNPGVIDSQSLYNDLFFPMYEIHEREESFPLLHVLKAYFFHPSSRNLLEGTYYLQSLEQAHKLLFSYLYRLKYCYDKDLKLNKEEVDIVNQLEERVLNRIRSDLDAIKMEGTEADKKQITTHLIEDLYYPIYKRLWVIKIDRATFDKLIKQNEVNSHFLKINHQELFEHKHAIRLVKDSNSHPTLFIHGNREGVEKYVKLIDAYGQLGKLVSATFSMHPTRKNELTSCKSVLDNLQDFYLVWGKQICITLKVHYDTNKYTLDYITAIMDKFVKNHLKFWFKMSRMLEQDIVNPGLKSTE